MANDAELNIKLKADASEATKSISKFSNSAKEQVSAVEKSFSALKVVAGAAVAAFAGVKIVSSIKAAVEAAKIQEDAVNSLNTSLKLAGSFSEEASRDIQNFASNLQSVTTIGDETTLKLFSLAKNFGLTNERTKDLTRAAIELSAATGTSLEAAITNLGKSTGGLVGELGESIPALKGLSKEALESGAAIDFVLDRFGGAAASKLQTFSGATTALSNSFGDLQERFGEIITKNEAVIAAINGVKNAFIDFGVVVEENQSGVSVFVTKSVEFLSGFAIFAAQTFQGVVDGITGFIIAIKESNIAIAEFQQKYLGADLKEFIDRQQAAIDKNKAFRDSVKQTTDSITIRSAETIGAIKKLEKGIVKAKEETKKFGDESKKPLADTKKSVEETTDAWAKQLEEIRKLPAAQRDAAFAGVIALEKLRGAQAEYEQEQKKSADAGIAALNKLREAQGEYEQEQRNSIIALQKAQEQADQDRLKSLKETQEQARQAITQGAISATSAVLGADSTSLLDVDKLKGEIGELSSSLNKSLSGSTLKNIQTILTKITSDYEKDVNQISQQIKNVEVELSAGDNLSEDRRRELLERKSSLQNELNQRKEEFTAREKALQREVEIREKIAAKELEIENKKDAVNKSTLAVLSQVAGVVGDILLPGFGGIISSITSFLGGGPEQIKALVTGLADGLPDIITAIADSIPALIEILIDRAPDIIEALADATPKIIESLIRKAPSIIETLVKRAPDIALAIIKSAFQAAIPIRFDTDELKEKVSEVIENLLEGVSNIPEKLGDAIQSYFDGLLSSFDAVIDAFNSIGTVFEEIAGLFQPLVDAFQSIINQVKGLSGSGGGGSTRAAGRNIRDTILGRKKLFAKGITEIPSGFPNDSFNAGLTSGERVVDADTNTDLKAFLKAANSGAMAGASGNVNLTIKLQVGQEELARQILKLDRSNFKLRA